MAIAIQIIRQSSIFVVEMLSGTLLNTTTIIIMVSQPYVPLAAGGEK